MSLNLLKLLLILSYFSLISSKEDINRPDQSFGDIYTCKVDDKKKESFHIPRFTKSIIPELSCWMQIWDNTVDKWVYFLVMGYTNEYNVDVYIQIGLKDNRMEPFGFNGKQSHVFHKGYTPFAFKVKIDNPKRFVFLKWSLNGTKLQVNPSDLADKTKRCAIKFKSHCPQWIESFCDDGRHCNGNEHCSNLTHDISGMNDYKEYKRFLIIRRYIEPYQSIQLYGTCISLDPSLDC